MKFALALIILALTAPTAAANRYHHIATTSLVPLPPGLIVIHEANCLGGVDPWSCYFDGTIWLTAEHAGNAPVFLHELGHAYDERVLKPRHRRLFMRWAGIRQGWTAVGSEFFASAYSLCARHRSLPEHPDTQYGWAPTQALHDKSCWLIRRAAR